MLYPPSRTFRATCVLIALSSDSELARRAPPVTPCPREHAGCRIPGQRRRPGRDSRVVVDAGSGPKGGGRLPPLFVDWHQLRVDVDPAVDPDVLRQGSVDLSAIPSGFADAVWTSHCLEHLYLHQVPQALAAGRVPAHPASPTASFA